MSASDTIENAKFTGNVTILASPFPTGGAGDIEVKGTVKSDNIKSNTITSGLINVQTRSQFSDAQTLGNTFSTTLTGNEGTINSSGDITLYNGTKNLIYFNRVGFNPPSTVTRSVGTKLVLYPDISTAGSLDYAIGVETNNVWFSAGAGSIGGFKFYSGLNTLFLLSSTFATFTANSTITGTTLNTVSSTSGSLATNGDLVLYNGVSAAVVHNTTTGAPAFTTRSNGTKTVLYPAISGTTLDFAMGAGPGQYWFTTSTTSDSFKYYSGSLTPTFSIGALNVNVNNTTTIVGTTSNVISSTSGALTVGGDVTIYSIGAFICDGTNNPPAFTTRSTGTGIVLSPGISGTTLDNAIGNNTNEIWFTTSGTAGIFKFYNGSTTSSLEIGGTGIDITNISAPGNPVSGKTRFYIDTADTKFKSKDNTGKVTVFNPVTTKGDLVTSDGVTNGTRLPVGSSGQILQALPSSTNGINWINYTPPIRDYVNENYGTAVTAITTTLTDLQIDQFRNLDNSGNVSTTNNTTVTINNTGVYLVFAKVTAVATAGTTATTVTVSMAEDIAHTGAGSFATVTNSSCGLFCNTSAVGNSASDAGYIIYCKSYTRYDRLKIQAQITVGTNTITQRAFGVTLSLVRFNVDGEFDASHYFSASLNALTLTGTYTGLTTASQFVIDASYTNTVGNNTITLNTAGTYVAYFVGKIQKTSGVDNTNVGFQIYKNGVAIGTISYAYVSNVTNNTGCTSGTVTFTAVATDTIQLRSAITAGTNISATGQLNLILVKSTTGTQASCKFGYFNSTGVNTTLTTTAATMPFSTTAINSGGIFTNTAGVITVSEDGFYYIFGQLTLNNSVATTSNAQMLLLTNNGTATNFIEGTYTQGHVNLSTGSANNKTISSFSAIYLPAGFKISVQAIRNSTGGTLATVGTNSTLSVFKASTGTTEFNIILPFGTYFNSAESNYTSATTSTSFVPKLFLSTGIVPAGWYKLEIQFKDTTLALTRRMEVQVTCNNVQIFLTQVSLVAATNTPVYSSYVNLPLNVGNYNFELDYRSVPGTQVSIREVVMNFYRVK